LKTVQPIIDNTVLPTKKTLQTTTSDDKGCLCMASILATEHDRNLINQTQQVSTLEFRSSLVNEVITVRFDRGNGKANRVRQTLTSEMRKARPLKAVQPVMANTVLPTN